MSDKKSLNEKYGKIESEEAVTDELQENLSVENIKKSKKAKKEKKVKEPKEKKARSAQKAKKKEQKLNKKQIVDEFWQEEDENSEGFVPIESEIKIENGPAPEDGVILNEESAEAELKEKKAKKSKKTKKEKKPRKPKEKKIKDKNIKEPEIPIEAEDLEEPEVPEESIESAEEPDFNFEIAEEVTSEEPILEEAVSEEAVPVKTGRQREEIIFENNKGTVEKTKMQKSKKEKKEKPLKTPKEKKVKEPKEKKVKEPKELKEKTPRDPLEKKDIVTIAVSLLALVLVLCVSFFAFFNTRSDEKKIQIVSKSWVLAKLFPEYAVNPDNGSSGDEKSKLSGIQVARDGLYSNLMQTDFSGVFYGINSDYTVQYYQYSNNRIVPVKYTDTVDLKVDMGSGILNVKMNYIKNGEYVSGVSVFTSNGNDGSNYFYNLVVFKLTVLPSEYAREGHALLLASTDKSALENSDVLWTESFDVNLNDGSMTRFLSVINRTIDEKGAGVADFCILNRAGYTASTKAIPFITSREYPVGSGLQDIFVKNGSKEGLLASNVYGKYLTVDGGAVIYLRRTTTGFDVIHNTDGEETVAHSFYGVMDTNYMISDKYLLSKDDGHLYDIVTDKDYTLVGYSMNVTSFAVSSDNRYVVMMGTVKNAVDYQIHIFDLQTGEYAKFKDNNYAPHSSLCFIDNNTVLYTAVEPNQGYEYVILDASKAFNK